MYTSIRVHRPGVRRVEGWSQPGRHRRVPSLSSCSPDPSSRSWYSSPLPGSSPATDSVVWLRRESGQGGMVCFLDCLSSQNSQ